MPHPPDLRRGTCVELVRPSYARAGAGIAMSSGTATGPGHGGDMSTPVAAHRLSADDGRRIFVWSSCEATLGVAYSELESSSCCAVPESERPLSGLSLAALNA